MANVWLIIFGISLAVTAFTMIVGALFRKFIQWPWIDRLIDKINLISLTRKPKGRNYGIIMLSVAFLDYVVFMLLYYVGELYIIGCLVMICGAIMKFVGLFEIYKSSRSVGRQVKLTIVIMLGIWVIGSQILYFTILLFTHITPTV